MNGTFSERVTPLITSAMNKRMLFAFDDAGPGNKKKIAGANSDVSDLKGNAHQNPNN